MPSPFPQTVLDEIKARTDLADLVSSYGVPLRRSGADYKACCPFHREKTPSFVVHPQQGYYHCFGCGEKGDAFTFVMKQEGLSFGEAVRKLARQCGVTVEERADPDAARRARLYALHAELAAFFRRCLKRAPEAEPARRYLATRRLPEDALEKFCVGYAPLAPEAMQTWARKHGFSEDEMEAAGVLLRARSPGGRPYNRFGGRLMFTVKDKQGRVVAFSGRQLVEKKNSGKYVNSPETAIFKKSNVLFGFDRAAGNIARAPHREVICCEGQIDTIRLHVNGFNTAVASQGTAFTEEHAKMIRRVADAAVLMYDDDAAGHKATIKVAGMLLAMEMPVRVVSLPDGDDPDSYLRRHSAADLQSLIDRAESIVSFQCRVERAKEENPTSIDAVTRVSRAVLATLAACPSAILRASLTDEAARLLGLPVVALTEELARAKASSASAPHPKPAPAPRPAEEAFDAYEEDFGGDVPFEPADDGDTPAPEPPVQAVPPPEREFALMAFLMANEYDRTLDGMVGDYLPADVFAHDFTRGFVATWRDEAARGEDLFAAYADGLSGAARGWFDRLLLEAERTQASCLSATDILQDFVRALWCDCLRRVRGGLPSGDPAAEARRMRLSMDLKQLQQARWNTVKQMVRDILARKEIG